MLNVNLNSLVIGGVDPSDYPDFSDAFFESGETAEGRESTEAELEHLTDKYPEALSEMAFESLI